MTGFGAYRDPNAPKPEKPITQEEMAAVPPEIQAWADDLLGVPKEKANGAGDNRANGGDIGEPPNYPEEPQATPLDGADWLRHAQRSKTGGPIPNLHNCLLALRSDPHWHGQFRFDAMARTVVIPDQPCEDVDIFRIHAWLQANGLPRMGVDAVREAVELVGRDAAFHPVKAWLEGLEWDGVPRLADLLVTYFGATPSGAFSEHYIKAVGPMWLIAMVARIDRPGCQSDYTPVLEGSQGELKSRACRILAGAHFSDHLPFLSSDEVRLSSHLRGKWLIEISELAAISGNRVESAQLKSFLTRREEIFTPKHARKEVHEPRQCVFVGTTNDDTYLRDETGGRRFWPMRCGQINIEALERDRDQLFAEAQHAYRQGAQWWPDRPFEKRYFEPVQASRLWVDAWQTPVQAWLVGHTGPLSLAHIANAALDLPNNRFGVGEQKRLAAVMRSIGWHLKRTMTAREWWPNTT